MRNVLITVLVAVSLSLAPAVDAAAKCSTPACVKRVAKKQKIHRLGFPFCNTWACVKRVKAKRAKRLRQKERREMRYYRRHPMPWCTWGPESGAYRGQWSMARYRQPNISGGTGGGKFQILDDTWIRHGGRAYALHAHWAKPVHQERVARRIMRSQGPGAWVGC